MVKSQILAGGRCLGAFKSGLKGGEGIVKTEEVTDITGEECPLSLSFNWQACYIHLSTTSLPLKAWNLVLHNPRLQNAILLCPISYSVMDIIHDRFLDKYISSLICIKKWISDC